MRKKILTILLCLAIGVLFANNRLSFRSFDVKSGISDNLIQSILRDQYGFIWFATINGLNRYDGYQFKQYTTTQLGTYNNDIESVSEDASGTIWIKTPSEYFFYNRENDVIDKNIFPILRQYGIEGEIQSLFTDENRNLWCIANNTLYYYLFSNQKLHKFALQKNMNVLQLVCRDIHAFLLLSDGTISKVDWNTLSIRNELQIKLSPDFPHKMYLDTSFRLWLYTAHASGIKCYDTKNKEWSNFAGQKELDSDFITAITDDGKGNIWIGTDNQGIYICQQHNNKFTRLYKDTNNPFSLPNNHINCFFKDNQNIMWIGTSKQGATFTYLNNIPFENYQLSGQEDVSCILEDNNRNLWFGFDGEGLACFDRKKQTFSFCKSKEGKIPSDLIVCSYLDSKGRIWFGSYGKGPFYEQNGNFHSIKNLILSNNKDDINYVRCITGDINENIWFGTFMQGLYCLDSQNKFIPYTKENSGLETNSITDLSCSDGHTLYIGTSAGLHCMDTNTRQIKLVKGNQAGTLSINDKFINCLYQDSRNFLWIGTRTGIYIYNIQNDKLTYLSKGNGLSHNYIRAITEDKDKDIWITTDHGITQILVRNMQTTDSLQFHCYAYFEEDGIRNKVFNNHSIRCINDGTVLMGGNNGYLKVCPKSLDIYSYTKPKVIFTGLFLANNRIDAGCKISDGRILLPKNIQLSNEITMDHSDSNFALEVSAMDYANQHKLQYAYRLNENEEWIKLDGNRIYFNKLSPGTYKLQVKVHENHIDSPVSSLVIHVRPPFWLSFLAYICYGIFLIFIVVFVFIRMQNKHRRLLLQQKHNMEIAQQHEMDESKLRFFTNVSHDLCTPLSLIIIPLEKLLSSEKIHEIKDELKLIHRSAVTLLNEVNQLLDFRKLDQHKVQLSSTHGNLSEFVKEICISFSSYSLKNNIQLYLQIQASVLNMDFDQNKMQRIMLNLLSNAVKYNTENGSITVTIDKINTPNGESAFIQVADTGIGIKDENKEKIFDRFFQEQHATTYVGNGIGLHIVKEYVSLHNGYIIVKDNHPQGTIFEIFLPLAQSESFESKTDILKKQKSLSASTDKANILVVEDNDDFRQFLTNCLQGKYQVYEASDGIKALEMLTQEPIQIVISDVMMPEMNGMELCHKIKTNIRYSHIPVILLTARSAEEHILSGLKEGADDYITKPFNLEILLLRIHKLLEWTKNNYKKFETIDISPAEITVSSLDEQLIEKAIQAVEKNMDNSEFSVEELSAYVGMSRSNLYKKLMSISGKSPIEFIRILRIKRGKQLLEQSQMSISQIAYQIGLSPKQFARYFKDEFGCIPSEYKKQKEN